MPGCKFTAKNRKNKHIADKGRSKALLNEGKDFSAGP